MSERKKQKPEEKVKIVKRYLAGEVSMSEAVTEAGVDWKTLQKWVMQYEAEGAAAFLPGRREHIYSPELKLQAVQEYLSGVSHRGNVMMPGSKQAFLFASGVTNRQMSGVHSRK